MLQGGVEVVPGRPGRRQARLPHALQHLLHHALAPLLLAPLGLLGLPQLKGVGHRLAPPVPALQHGALLDAHQRAAHHGPLPLQVPGHLVPLPEARRQLALQHLLHAPLHHHLLAAALRGPGRPLVERLGEARVHQAVQKPPCHLLAPELLLLCATSSLPLFALQLRGVAPLRECGAGTQVQNALEYAPGAR